jgi:hypothetical protein
MRWLVPTPFPSPTPLPLLPSSPPSPLSSLDHTRDNQNGIVDQFSFEPFIPFFKSLASGYFDIPVDHVYGESVILDYLASKRINPGEPFLPIYRKFAD